MLPLKWAWTWMFGGVISLRCLGWGLVVWIVDFTSIFGSVLVKALSTGAERSIMVDIDGIRS